MFKRNSGSWILKGSSPLLFLTYNKDTSKTTADSVGKLYVIYIYIYYNYTKFHIV